MSVHTLIRACTTPNQPTLHLGDSGPDVDNLHRLLQSTLRGLGSAGIDIGDPFGPETEVAVQAFQRQVFLKVDGIVGPNTWKALCANAPVDMPVIRQGDRTPAVRQAQERLAQAGYYTANIDGDFGPVTHTAVTQFQQAQNLAVDGIIGPNTWEALSRV